MRIGVNPEKYKEERNELKLHRVIMPVHIPSLQEEFYKESLEVFHLALKSLIETIDPSTTCITVINNNSIDEVGQIIDLYGDKIDKIIRFNENRGKVYGVVNEAKGSFEPFVTISDADVIFFAGWENEVWQVFENYPKAGIVSPLPTPNNSFIYNCSLFLDHFVIGKMKYGKIVADRDLDLYSKGLNNTSILNRQNKEFSWKEKQYYLDGNYKAVVGATHFVATYRTVLFESIYDFPEFKFKKGYEDNFLDNIGDKKGFYRLSTIKSLAYHQGNKLDDTIDHFKPVVEENILIDMASLKNCPFKRRSIIIPYFAKKLLFRFLKKYFNL